MGAQLLVRPRPHEDEWLWSWAARAAWTNGFTNLRACSVSSYERVLAGMIPTEKAVARDAVSSSKLGVARFGATVLPTWAVRGRSGAAAVCTACLREGGAYVRQTWRLTGMEVCTEHGEVLQSKCAACGHAFGMTDVIRQSCICGCVLAARAQIGNEQELALARSFWAQVDNSTLALRVAAWDLLRAVARARRGRDLPLTDRRIGEHAAQWLQEQKLGFEPSVQGVEIFLSDLPSPIHQASAMVWLKRVQETEREHPTALSGLPLKAWVDRLLALGAPQAKDRLVGIRSLVPKMPGYVPMLAAARTYGASYCRLRRAAMEGRIEHRMVPGARQPIWMLRETDVQRLVQDGGVIRTIRRQEEGMLDGLSQCARRLLRVGGLLDLSNSGRSLRDMPLTGVINSMLQHAHPRAQAPTSLIRLTDRAWWHGHRAEAICFWLQEASQGLRPLYRDADAMKLSGLYTTPEQLHFLWRMCKGMRHQGRALAQPDLFGGETPQIPERRSRSATGSRR